MKREEHYCDICGQQMTRQTVDGDTDLLGIFSEQAVRVSMSKPHSCGTSGKSESLRGKEFCSFECFSKSVDKWMADIAGFWK